MGGPYESPVIEEREWEPEPLTLPLEQTYPTQEGHRDERETSETDEPGSHVIVIDLA